MSQSKPHEQRQIRWFCKLCRSYDVKLRRDHLIKVHNAKDHSGINKKYSDIIEVVFIEVKT